MRSGPTERRLGYMLDDGLERVGYAFRPKALTAPSHHAHLVVRDSGARVAGAVV